MALYFYLIAVKCLFQWIRLRNYFKRNHDNSVTNQITNFAESRINTGINTVSENNSAKQPNTNPIQD